MYTIEDNVRLYVADSIDEIEALQDVPPEQGGPFDHGAGLMADAGSKAFLIEREYSHEPEEQEIADAYARLGDVLYAEMNKNGVYTKEVYLIKSHPEVSLPNELEDAFAQHTETPSEILMLEKEPKACLLLSLVPLLFASEQQQT
jgi:hypothetical protein